MQSCRGGFVIDHGPKLFEMLWPARLEESGMLGGYVNYKGAVRVGAKRGGKMLEAGEYEWQVLTRRFRLDGFEAPKRKALMAPGGCW